MELRKLQRIVVDALEDIKGQDIRVYNTEKLTGLFDRVVVVSGTSNRQTRSMAAHVAEKVKAAGGEVISIEGEETGEWVLIDLADIVVHVMQPAIRAYYNLEELWGGKPVRVKLGGQPAASRATADAPGAGHSPASAPRPARAQAAPAPPAPAARPSRTGARSPG